MTWWQNLLMGFVSLVDLTILLFIVIVSYKLRMERK